MNGSTLLRAGSAPSSPLTPSEAARELAVTPHTIRRWLACGRLSGERVGDRLRVDRESLASVRQTIRRAEQ